MRFIRKLGQLEISRKCDLHVMAFYLTNAVKFFYVRNLRMFYTAEEFVPRLMFATLRNLKEKIQQ
jgi:hypothetical protein